MKQFTSVQILLAFILLFSVFCDALLQLFEFQEDCKTYNGTRPMASSLSKARQDYINHTDPRSKSVDSPKLDHSQNNAYKSKQFNCTYHRPIRWVFHFDPLNFNMQITIDFSERILRENSNEYTANFKFLYFDSDVKSSETKLFSCEVQPVELSKNGSRCEKDLIQVISGATFEDTPVATPNAALEDLSQRLLISSLEEVNETLTLTPHHECKTHLSVKVERGNVIKYKWDSPTLTLTKKPKAFPTNETTYLENAFRLSGSKDKGCARILPETEPCVKCIPVGDKNTKVNITSENSLNAVIFYGNFSDGIRVHKGHFSVPKGDRKERKFYFLREITPFILQEEMVQLELEGSSSFTNIPFQVKCRVSVFHFAYGSKILQGDEQPEVNKTFEEVWSPHGYRVISYAVTFNESGDGSVGCWAPLRRSEEWIKKYMNVSVTDPLEPAINGIISDSTEIIEVSEEEEGIIMDCNVTGNPVPKLKWILPNTTASQQVAKNESSNGFNRLTFPKWESALKGSYKCISENRFGTTFRTVTFTNSSLNLTPIISSSLGAFTFLLGVIVFLLIWKIRRQRLDFKWKLQKAIDDFRNGISIDNEDDMAHANCSVLQLPYNEKFEKTRDHWIVEDKILGSGQFGLVRMGSVDVDGTVVKLAVKTLKSTVEIDEFKNFLFELKVMAFLETHKNIVSLVAACTDGINDRDILIGVEFCDNGCLLNYLRKHRAVFRNMVTPDGKIISDASRIENNFESDNGTYANISSFTISTYDLYRWGYHIACGMEYLREKKVLHGDLAARNVLLTQRKVAKVGDFGFSRVLMNSDNYTKRSETALPWKWMALESLKERVFSVNSDVWAFGITLTELFSLGQSPYPGMGWSPDFISRLENGMRMERPVFCTNAIYKIMRSCWHNAPNHRPTYAKIKSKLSKGLKKLALLSHAAPAKVSAASQGQGNVHKPLIPVMLPIDEDAGGIYSNMQRSTLNYYKNC